MVVCHSICFNGLNVVESVSSFEKKFDIEQKKRYLLRKTTDAGKAPGKGEQRTELMGLEFIFMKLFDVGNHL